MLLFILLLFLFILFFLFCIAHLTAIYDRKTDDIMQEKFIKNHAKNRHHKNAHD